MKIKTTPHYDYFGNVLYINCSFQTDIGMCFLLKGVNCITWKADPNEAGEEIIAIPDQCPLLMGTVTVEMEIQ